MSVQHEHRRARRWRSWRRLLEVRDLGKHYRLPRESLWQPAPIVHALDGVSFPVEAGRSLGIVGESGSGKSTLARLVMALEPPTAGSVRMLGRDLHALRPSELRRARRDFQMVFQDPYGSLDPRQRVGRIVAEPLAALGGASAAEQRERVAETLDAVGLRAADMRQVPARVLRRPAPAHRHRARADHAARG